MKGPMGEAKQSAADEPGGGSVGDPLETSLWLVPAGDDAELLDALIRELAARCGGPVFAPHASLYGHLRGPLDRLDPILAEAARNTPPAALLPTGVGHTEGFFRCLYLELAEPSPVTRLRQRLAAPLGRRPDDAAPPHLSLLYAELPAAERRALARELAPRLPGPLRCDALELVAPRRDDEVDWRDVAGWRVVRRYPLGGPAAEPPSS